MFSRLPKKRSTPPGTACFRVRARMSRIGLVETFLISGMLALLAMAGSHLPVKANAAASGPADHDYVRPFRRYVNGIDFIHEG